MKTPSGKHFEYPRGMVLQICEALFFTKTYPFVTSICDDCGQRELAGNDKSGSARFITPGPDSTQQASVKLKVLRRQDSWPCGWGPQSSQTYQSWQKYKAMCWMLDGQRDAFEKH